MKKRLLKVLLSIMLLFGTVVAVEISDAEKVEASVLGDDYPSYLKQYALDATVDPWNFYNRECTSFVAWRLNNTNGVSFTNWYKGYNFGNAYSWDDAARSAGIPVNNTPAVGAVAQTDSGGYGHVAWVAQVNNDGTIVIEEYNWNYDGAYHYRTVSSSSFVYIHIKDVSTPTVSFSRWENSNYTFIGWTNAGIGQYVNVSGGSWSKVGMILYTSSGTKIGEASGTPTSGENRYYYNINNEMNISISSGTTYKFRFYAVVDGKTYYSDYQTFKTDGPTEAFSVTFADWENPTYTYIDYTDASIGQEVDITGGSVWTEVGMELYNSSGEKIGKGSDTPTSGEHRYYYSINKELGVVLTKGTTYKYRFYVVVDGITHYSNYKTFTTLGGTTVVKPTVSWDSIYCYPSKNNVVISIMAKTSIQATYEKVGIKICDKDGKEIVNKEDICSNYKGTYLNIWYDILSETNVALVKNSEYSYQFYALINGDKYESPVYSFSTKQNDSLHFGIDVSSHQGKIDWDIASKYIDFAIIRCGFGSDYEENDDTYWEYNVSECERLNIPYAVYLYSYAENVSEATSEANHVLRLLNGCDVVLPIFYDLEDSNTVGKLSNDNILKQAEAFCKIISDAGYTPGIYASSNWWNNKLTSTEYSKYVKWIAAYGGNFANLCQTAAIWQYSSDGNVPGVNGRVDVNICYNSLQKNNNEHSEWKTEAIADKGIVDTNEEVEVAVIIKDVAAIKSGGAEIICSNDFDIVDVGWNFENKQPIIAAFVKSQGGFAFSDNENLVGNIIYLKLKANKKTEISNVSISLVFKTLVNEIEEIAFQEIDIPKYVKSIYVSTNPIKTQYKKGETLDINGAVLKVVYSDNSIKYLQMTSDMIQSYDTSILGVNSVIVSYAGFSTSFNIEIKGIIGDLDGNASINSDDAIYLLMATLFPNDYPLNQDVDFDGNGVTNSDDAIYLLMHTLFPENYPLVKKKDIDI